MGEEVQPSLMVMAGPHYLGMTTKNDQIYFPLQYSHRDPTSQIQNSSFQRSWGFQEGHHEFYDPIIEWLEQSYLASSVVVGKFQSFLALAENLGADEETLTRHLWGLLKNSIHGKVSLWIG